MGHLGVECVLVRFNLLPVLAWLLSDSVNSVTVSLWCLTAADPLLAWLLSDSVNSVTVSLWCLTAADPLQHIAKRASGVTARDIFFKGFYTLY